MSLYTDVYDYVLPDIPGAPPDSLVTQAIRDAVIEFCRRTKLYTFDHPAISTVNGTSTYTLTPQVDAIISDVLYAEVNKEELSPQSKRELDIIYENWRDSDVKGTPKYYYLNNTHTSIRLVKTPDTSVTNGLLVSIAQKPTRTGTVFPSFIFDDWIEVVQSGAKWKLFAMHRKPWSNPNLAGFHRQIFEAEVGAATIQADKENTRTPLRVRPMWR